MKRSTKGFLVAFSAASMLSLLLIAAGRLSTVGSVGSTSRQVLTLRLEGAFPDVDPNAPINELLGVRVITLPDVVRALDHAASDPHVAGLQIHAGPLQTGWARAQELRAALLRFRASGKPVHAFMEMGDDGTYFLASAAERIRMIPSSTLWLDGIAADVTFYGGTLGKIGVQADIEQIGAYKNAADVMKRSTMSDPHREAMNALLDGLYGELVSALSESLGQSPERVAALVAAGPYSAQGALDAGLVNALGYEDETGADLDAAIGRELPRIKLDRYLREVPVESGASSIAVIHCNGAIASGESTESLLGGGTLGADTIARSIRAAREDGAKAVILRVDSPGGSATASDVIWRETMRTRDAGIPVVVSMADVAASGGYWISMGADHVVASPATITGSIGIYGGKYVVQGLNALVGLNVEPVERGANSGLMSSRRPFTDAQREWLQGELHSVYRLFIERTAQGRGFPSAEAVDRIAQGRVWTGRQALELGLVDELGGFREAEAKARELAHLPAEGGVSFRDYPRSPTIFELLREGGPSAAISAVTHAVAAREAGDALPSELRETLGAAPSIRLLESGVLAWTPIAVQAR